MKRMLILCLWSFIVQGVWAQYNELGIFLGGSNAVSDVGRSAYVFPQKWAYGVIYKRNLNKRLALRADLRKTVLWDNDTYSSVPARQSRGFSFENKLTELGVGAELNFLEFNVHSSFDVLFTSYVHSGVYRFWADNLHFAQLAKPNQQARVQKDPQRFASWALPFTVGVKTRLGATRFLLGAEVGLRYAFTNNLEGSKPEQPAQWFGNLNANDWYFMSGFYITYTFGQKDCQCF